VLVIAGYLGGYPSPTDLAAFMLKYGTDGADATFVVVRVNYDPSRPHSEANLDLQHTEAMAYLTPSVAGLGTPDFERLLHILSN